MDDLIAEFLTETGENLGELDQDLVKLEQNPNDKELLSKIFRVIHTIKGTCGFLGLPRLEAVAHKGEDVLGLFRDGALEVTPEYVTLIFESLDRIKFILEELETNGEEPAGDDSELIQKLAGVLENAGVQSDGADVVFPSDEEQSPAPVEAAAPEQDNVTEASAEVPQAQEAQLAEEQQESKEAAPRENSVANQSLRVNVDVLEKLMTMVSELVLTRNQLLQISRSRTDSEEFTTPLQRLNHVVSDLQEGVMQTRMQPIGNAWAKLPRIIRDIMIELGKKIDLEMHGQETELDRQVLELIKDPLTHMVRNSADHGIEPPEERLAAGKPETGTIKLDSYHEGGHIIIEITDDGKGLSTAKIKEKVLANNLATEDELAELSPQQLQQFIFKPGFSTAEKVTSVSGRGVGMDVVRTNIEKIGGSIELKSVEGKGTSVLIKIPLTLAIVSALIIESGHEKFAIPQLAVRELVMTSADGDSRIETIKGTPVFRLRDRLLPLVPLQELLQLDEPREDGGDKEDKSRKEKQSRALDEAKYINKYIVVMQVGSFIFGVIVDKVFDTEEIVIKPVANVLRDIEIFSGNTILGDGSVIMILDPAGIAKNSGDIEVAEARDADVAEESDGHLEADKTSLLLFAAGDKTPKAVPLELVSRLEDVKTDMIERANGMYVVQYRDDLMPLVLFDPDMDLMAAKSKPTLVFSDKGYTMGLVIDEIIDITDQHIDVRITSNNEQTLGSTVIEGKATDVINVAHYLNQVDHEWFKDHDDQPFDESKQNSGQTTRILLVEDSPFFLNLLTPLLRVAGYNVTTTESAIDALKLCEKGYEFDLIVSDIEMPEMNGFEFAQQVKTRENWQNIPLVALSSHTTPQDMDRGIQAGFTKYIAKFDRDALLATLSQTLAETYGEAA